MAFIARGTTPTIIYKFKEVDPADIVESYLVVKQFDKPVLEKDFSRAVVGEDTLEYTFTQTETLTLKQGHKALIVCDWKLDKPSRSLATSFPQAKTLLYDYRLFKRANHIVGWGRVSKKLY